MLTGWDSYCKVYLLVGHVQIKLKNKNTMKKQKVPELIEYIHADSENRDGSVVGVGPLIGCVLARRVRYRQGDGKFGSGISIGWSKVNKSAGDKFTKKDAVEFARNRAISLNYGEVPRKLTNHYLRMIGRANRYFKNIDWV